MTVNFYKTFSKRKNSTKQPAAADAHDAIDCKLKEDCSIENPSFIISQRRGSASGNPVTVNAKGGYIENGIVTFNPIQTGSGTPSPSNPRPIAPYTSINVDVNGNTTVIDLNGNKYGGVLDVSTGVLTIKYAIMKVGDYNWTYNSQYSFFLTNAPFIKNFSTLYAENYANASFADIISPLTDNIVCMHADNYLRLKDTRYNDGLVFKTNEANSIICYELKTYETIQFTPAEIALAVGANTITVNGNSSIAFDYVKEKIDLTYTYVQVPDFNRYYFVSNVIILSNNRVEYICECDALASFKTNIGSTVAHIAYAATGWDKWLIDSKLPVKTTKNINSQVAASGLSNSGMYVVAIINDRSATKLGACTFYMMTERNMNNLAYNLSDQGIITDLRNIFNNPLDSIVKAVWIPLAPTSVPQTHYDNAELVYAGSRALDLAGHECYGAPIKDFVVELDAVSLLIPDKHQDFRDASPFTTGSLYLPGLGLTDLNMSDFIESVNVNIKTYIDITTGDITYRIYEDNGHILKTCIFNGATEIPLAHVTNNAGGTLASIGGVAGGAITAAIAGASGNLPVAFGGIATALASGTSAVMQSAMRATSIKGGIAGRSAFYDVVFKLLIVQLETEDPDDANYIAMFGRPVGVTHAISNHSGFVQCENASVVMSGSVLERDRINDYLNTGFFYE